MDLETATVALLFRYLNTPSSMCAEISEKYFMKTVRLLIFLACCTVFCSGCMHSYMAYRGSSKEPLKLSQLAPTNESDFAGVTFVLQDIERPEMAYYLAQSYPHAFVVVISDRDPKSLIHYPGLGYPSDFLTVQK